MPDADLQYPLHVIEEPACLFSVNGLSFRQDTGLVQNFVGINIADACYFLLVHEPGFDAATFFNGVLKTRPVNVHGIGAEPFFFNECVSVIDEQDLPELSDGDEDKTGPILKIDDQGRMIHFFRVLISEPDTAGHAEVQDLFPGRSGGPFFV